MTPYGHQLDPFVIRYWNRFGGPNLDAVVEIEVKK